MNFNLPSYGDTFEAPWQGAGLSQGFLIPLEQFLYSIFYLNLMRPAKRMQFAYINELSHSSIRLRSIKLYCSFKTDSRNYQFRQFTNSEFFARTYIDMAIADLHQKGQYLYIPKGFAHGFVSLEDGSIVNYAQTTCYAKDNDCGIDTMSIGFDWGVDNPIRSGRDLTFPKLSDFDSPF